MNKELIKLHEWLCINRLSLNIAKTNFVIFHPRNKPKLLVTLLINKNAIDEVNCVKYLGILIDSKLTFRSHIDELNKKVSRAIGVLYKIRPFVTSTILSSIYYAIIYPFLLYGIIIWGNVGATLLNPILILQKKSVCTATFNDGFHILPGPLAHTPPLFHKLNLLNIFKIFELQLGKLVYESINGLGPTNDVINFFLTSDIHCYYTRRSSQHRIYRKWVRTTRYGLNSLEIEGAKLWDYIPDEIKYSISKTSFIARFKKHLVESYI